jgi:hypothetical protein
MRCLFGAEARCGGRGSREEGLIVNRIVVSALVATLALLWGSTAEAMHCRNRVVNVGDSAARVLALCGEPTQLVERVEQRTRYVQRRGRRGVLVAESVTVEVVIQQWVYDYGPTRLMRELVFEEGQLRSLRTLGYGTSARVIEATPPPRRYAAGHPREPSSPTFAVADMMEASPRSHGHAAAARREPSSLSVSAARANRSPRSVA